MAIATPFSRASSARASRPSMLSINHRRLLYRQLSLAFERDLSLIPVLKHVSYSSSDEGRHPRRKIPRCVDSWRFRMRVDGVEFHRAVQGWLPQSHCTLLECANTANSLTAGVRGCLLLDSETRRMKSIIFSAIGYPFFLLLVMLALLYFFTYEITPLFVQIGPLDSWQGIGAVLASLVRFVHAGGPIFVSVTLVMLILGFVIILPRWVSPLRATFEDIPPFNFYRLFVASSFLLSIAILIDAGTNIPQVLSVIRRHSSPWMRSKIDLIRRFQYRGEDFAFSFAKSDPTFPDRHFNRDLILLMQVGGSIASLEDYTVIWLRETLDRLDQSTAFIRTIFMAIAAALLAIIMLGNLAVSKQFSSSFAF